MKIKNNININISIKLSLVLLCACSDGNGSDVTPENYSPISFSHSSVVSQMPSNTRGTLIDDEKLKSDKNKFGVMMYQHEDISNGFRPTSSKPDYLFNAPYAYSEAHIEWVPQIETGGWPFEGTNPGLSFFTYFPYIDSTLPDQFGGGTEFKIRSDNTKAGSPRFRYKAGENVASHQDIMIGNPRTLLNCSSAVGAARPISFAFDHILSSAVFSRQVSYAPDAGIPSAAFRFTVQRIEINGATVEGEFEALTDGNRLTSEMGWTLLEDTPQSLVLNAGLSTNPDNELENEEDQGATAENAIEPLCYENSGVVLIPPQINAPLVIKIIANVYDVDENDRPITRVLNLTKSITQTFVANKKYNFIITYIYEGPVEGDVDIIGKIVPWEEKNIIIPPYI